MIRQRSSKLFADFFRRLFAAGGAALVLALTVCAASPTAHEWLHVGPDHGGEDYCAVVLFASGVSLPLGATPTLPAVTERRDEPVVIAQEIWLASPRYLRHPERGPPVKRVG